MINYPVHYDEELGGIYDKSCHFICDVSSKTHGNEIVKRINMHDDLVAKLKECTNELSSCIRESNKFINEPDGDFFDYQTVHECYELLEKCK